MDSGNKRCSSGHTIDDDMVIARTRYSKIGWFILSLAYSAQPIEVIFQCQICGEIIEKSKDLEVIEKFRYNSDIIK